MRCPHLAFSSPVWFRKKRLKASVLVFYLLWGMGCAHRPIDELVLADVALKAAQKAKADAFAPDTYRKAENFYLRAKKDYTEGYFDSSRKFADEARRTAERAEFQSLVKQAQVRGRPDEGLEAPSRPRPEEGNEMELSP